MHVLVRHAFIDQIKMNKIPEHAMDAPLEESADQVVV